MIHRTVLFTFAAARMLSAQAALPTEWIDPDTGHRVIRLSREDGTQSLYFNQNAYTADGKKLIVTTAGGGIATITLATREVKPLVAGPCLGDGGRSQDVATFITRSDCRAAKAAAGGAIPPGLSCMQPMSIRVPHARSSNYRRDGTSRH